MECSICYNKFHIYGILDCSHKFCTECLYKWLGNHRQQTSSTCPLCREKYKLDNIRITSSTNVLTRSMLTTHREEDFVLNLCKKSYNFYTDGNEKTSILLGEMCMSNLDLFNIKTKNRSIMSMMKYMKGDIIYGVLKKKKKKFKKLLEILDKIE